ncbi:MAG: hypothetical protein KUG61_10955, partial [Parvibaculaceae bacterium]|nr:hypothetical protein [Parvibaculaceae bacterium]
MVVRMVPEIGLFYSLTNPMGAHRTGWELGGVLEPEPAAENVPLVRWFEQLVPTAAPFMSVPFDLRGSSSWTMLNAFQPSAESGAVALFADQTVSSSPDSGNDGETKEIAPIVLPVRAANEIQSARDGKDRADIFGGNGE